MVVPVLTYGTVAWFASKSNTKLIEGVQRDATRWIVGYHSSLSYSEKLAKLKLLPLSFNMQTNDLLLLS